MTERGKRPRALFLPASFFLLLGLCAAGASLVCAQEEAKKDAQPQIERGKPFWILDAIGNVLSLPKKIILLNPKVDSHSVSKKTEQDLRDFLEAHQDQLGDVKVRLNQWTPVGDLKRLVQNKRVEWYFRVFPGIPVTLWSSLTGRILGGDHYNPYTHTVHLFSDDTAIALHEAGHAEDFARNPSPGLYALGRILPPVTLAQEQEASDIAIRHFQDQKDRAGELHAYSTLYPAFGTYAGDAVGLPYGELIGAGAGHVLGGVQRYGSRLGYQALDEARVGGTVRDDELSRTILARDEEDRLTFLKALQKE